jgi:hypothetical protein
MNSHQKAVRTNLAPKTFVALPSDANLCPAAQNLELEFQLPGLSSLRQTERLENIPTGRGDSVGILLDEWWVAPANYILGYKRKVPSAE